MQFVMSGLVFVLGLIIGSFLNVCIYRIPRGQSIVFPPSACPSCGRRLTALELIPVAAFIALRGRCRGCGTSISRRYPLVELMTGILFLMVFWKFGFGAATLKWWVLFSVLLTLSMIDLEFQLIPDLISLPGVVAGILLNYSHWAPALFGALLGYAVVTAVILLSRGGMGWGDAKLLAMIGAFLGWRGVMVSLFGGSLLGSVVGIILLTSRRIDRKTPMPFGPYLSLGALIFFFIQGSFF